MSTYPVNIYQPPNIVKHDFFTAKGNQEWPPAMKAGRAIEIARTHPPPQKQEGYGNSVHVNHRSLFQAHGPAA